MPHCKHLDCEKPYYAKGFCQTHYNAALRDSLPLYNVWRGMKERCNNENHKGYKYYGGAGITYTQEWETYTGFVANAPDGYQAGMALDRIDNQLGYSKANCRWVTQGDNNRNRDYKLTRNQADEIKDLYFKRRLSQPEIAKLFCVHRKTISRIVTGKTWN